MFDATKACWLGPLAVEARTARAPPPFAQRSIFARASVGRWNQGARQISWASLAAWPSGVRPTCRFASLARLAADTLFQPARPLRVLPCDVSVFRLGSSAPCPPRSFSPRARAALPAVVGPPAALVARQGELPADRTGHAAVATVGGVLYFGGLLSTLASVSDVLLLDAVGLASAAAADEERTED